MSSKAATTTPEKPTTAAEASKKGTDDYVKAQKAQRESQSELENQEVTDNQIAQQFSSNPANEEDMAHMKRINNAGAAFAQVIKDNTRNCADQTAAIRLVRLAKMTANACVMLKGR